MKMLGAGFRRAHVAIGLVVVLFVSVGSICEPNPDPNQPYTLKIYHQSDQQPWKTVHSGGWLNIHAAELCDENGFVDCHDPAPVCTERPPNEMYQVSVNDVMEQVGREFRRDRIAFFNEHPAHYWNPPYDTGTPPYFWRGYWRYWEGEGESNIFSPFGASPAGSDVGLIRRYQRGKCSTSEEDFSGRVSDAVRDTMTTSFKCPRNPLLGWVRAVKDVDVLAENTVQLFNTDECYLWDSENKDFIQISKTFRAWTAGAGLISNIYFDVEIVMWFRLVSGRRSAYLDCPTASTCPESCYDSEQCLISAFPGGPGAPLWCQPCFEDCKTRTCTQDTDCCDLPGVVCLANEQSDVLDVYGAACNNRKCEKRYTIDVKDYGFDFGANPSGNCSSNLYCALVYSSLVDELNKYKANPYKYVFAPLLQALHDEMWQKTIVERPDTDPDGPLRCGQEIDPTICDFFRCNNDEECQRGDGFIGYAASNNFESRCNDQGFCEIRPMRIYNVNQYPNAIEFVLAWKDNSKETTLYELADFAAQFLPPPEGEEPAKPMCKSYSPDEPDDEEYYGWSDLMPFGGAIGNDGVTSHQ
ncbi:MAG: hypothetical protein ABIK83_14075 [Candidatus Zixiibacteriota bacterium]